MIKAENRIFQLHTDHTSYVFRAAGSGHLEHLYYGKSLGVLTEDDVPALEEKVPFPLGNMIAYDKEHPTVTLENLCLEMSSQGKGDIREPFVEIVHDDGGRTCDFLFESAEILPDKQPYETLPGSYGLPENEHLCVTLKEKGYGLTLELHYYVYPEEDVICRSSRLVNGSKVPVRLTRLMSSQLDLPDSGYVFTSFTGAWVKEMQRHDTLLEAGTFSVSSAAGCTSSRANPFFMMSRPQTTEESGECLGFNLIYSGNHSESAQVNSFGKTRVLNGINPDGFCWLLEPGAAFEAPESVMTWSGDGFRRLSLNMSRFVKEHIIRDAWKNRERPVLINSWEASYFKFDESSLLKLARAAKDVGIELFVLDDGWFGQRNDDATSLGDWTENRKKLPNGLKGLSKKITDLGLQFGLWIEPEMVNVNSDLYRAHPGWAMDIPGQNHSEGRNQRILDLSNPEVVDWLTETFTRVLSSADISYVKWDMNRIFSDVYSKYLPADSQGETAHRYMMGLYRLLGNLMSAFPDILFEGCASGGGRFDLGMLCYFPQIWGSDDTDPVCRAKIQEGYSFGYPLSCVGAHVSASPNHQTLRSTPLASRFNVAAFGLLGYELNLPDLKKEELSEIREEIKIYKEWRGVLQGGNFYRLKTDGGLHSWICVSQDRTRAVGMILQEMVQPDGQYAVFRAAGLKPEARYHFYNLPVKYDIREFGSLVNTASPIHIRQGSFLERVAAKFVKMPGEKEDYTVSGSVLMNAGVKLKGAFTGNGYSEDVRLFKDYASRMYFMEEAPGSAPAEGRKAEEPEQAGKTVSEAGSGEETPMEKYRASSYAGHEEELLKAVGRVIRDFSAAVPDDSSLRTLLGLDSRGWSGFCQKYGLNGEEDAASALANAMVLFLADSISSRDFIPASGMAGIIADTAGNVEDRQGMNYLAVLTCLIGAAAAYYGSRCSSEGYRQAFRGYAEGSSTGGEGLSSLNLLLEAFAADSGFDRYCSEGALESDLEAFYGAMVLLSSHSGDFNVQKTDFSDRSTLEYIRKLIA